MIGEHVTKSESYILLKRGETVNNIYIEAHRETGAITVCR
jgi:hypothetical protein